MAATVQVIGAEEAALVFKKIPPTLERYLTRASEATAQAIVARAKTLVPVRTGALRNAIGYTVERGTGYCQVGILRGVGLGGVRPTRYAHLVEFGHAGPRGPAAPHPFMIPAAEAERQAHERRAREAILTGAASLEAGLPAAWRPFIPA
jgi:Bacteriophage HK97-gp10, putative tail-component